MSKKNNRRGFTIVELVIVIAVIAILAAVLIPTFSSLIKKANMSVDMQVVNQMNTVLQADEIVSGKPATVVEAKAVLAENGCDDFTPHDSQNVFYWIGAENRVILWEKDEPISAAAFVVVASADDGVETGKVTYPKDMAKKYKNLTEPSVDWSDLSVQYVAQNITPADGQTVEEALLAAVVSAPINDSTYLALPRNSTLTFGKTELANFCNALKTDAGVGKNVHIDLNGGTLNASNPDASSNAFYIPDGATLEFANGKMDVVASRSDSGGFQVEVGSSLMLRNIELTGDAHTMIFPSSEASEVIIDGCDIQVKSGWILMTNGMTSRNIRIVINDSYLKNTDLECDFVGFGVMVNCTSNVHIENSTISSYIAAVAARAGHVEVIDSTLEAYGTDAGIYKYDSFTHFFKKPKTNGAYVEGASETYVWSSGNAIAGAVLVAGDYARETESFQGDVVVDLTNVTFKSADTSEIPYCLVAAKLTKNVDLTYDDKTNIDEVKMYNYMIPQYFGSITVNGVAKTLG